MSWFRARKINQKKKKKSYTDYSSGAPDMMRAIVAVRVKRMHFLMKDEGTVSYPYKGSEIGISAS